MQLLSFKWRIPWKITCSWVIEFAAEYSWNITFCTSEGSVRGNNLSQRWPHLYFLMSRFWRTLCAKVTKIRWFFTELFKKKAFWDPFYISVQSETWPNSKTVTEFRAEMCLCDLPCHPPSAGYHVRVNHKHSWWFLCTPCLKTPSLTFYLRVISSEQLTFRKFPIFLRYSTS